MCWFCFKVFLLKEKVPLSFYNFLEHIQMFWFCYDPKLRYGNICAFVLISLTLLVMACYLIKNIIYRGSMVYSWAEKEETVEDLASQVSCHHRINIFHRSQTTL
jgi:hypothetical protein